MANEFKIKKGLIVTGASGGTVVDIQGSQGQLFSVTDDLNGSIFAVSDISGVPIFDVNSSGISYFDGKLGIGLTPTTVNLEVKSIQDISFDEGIGVVRSNTSQTGYINMVGGAMNINAPNAVPIKFRDGGNTNLTIGGDGHATFAGDVVVNNSLSFSTNGFADFGNIGTGAMRFKPSGNTLALTLTGTNATIVGKATSAQTAASDSSITLTTKSYVDGLVTGVPVYKGTWDARTQAEGGLAGDGGNPNLRLAANKILGNYYIVSTAGSATPNGAGTQPDSWNVGDWCIFSDVTPGAGTDLWQKIDNTSVISGAGTGQTLPLWSGSGTSNTLTDSLVSQPDTTTVQLNNADLRILNDLQTGGNGKARIKFSEDSGNAMDIYYDGDGQTGDANYTSIFSHKSGIGDVLVTTYGGNVGIGVTAPSYKLDVEGDVRLGGTNAQNYPIKMGRDTHAVYLGGPNINTINVAWDTNTDYNMHLNYVGYAGGVTQFRNLVVNDGKQGHIATFDGSSGNVGIGETNPSYKLDVRAANGSIGQVFIKGGNNSVTAVGEINSELLFGSNDGSVAQGNIGGKISSVTETTNGAYTGMAFYTYKQTSPLLTEKMRITHAGNVGIGTTDPDAKVEISQASSGLQYEALRLTNTADSGNMGAYISWHDSYSVDQMQLISQRDGAGNGSIFTFNQRISGVLSPALVLKNGNVGIGVTGPTEKLVVGGKVIINNSVPPNAGAQLNIGSTGSGETRAIDIDGSWSNGENKSITFNYGLGADLVGQIKLRP